MTKIILLLLCEKTRVEASKLITNPQQTLDFATPIALKLSFDTNNFIYGLNLTKLGTKQAIKGIKLQS